MGAVTGVEPASPGYNPGLSITADGADLSVELYRTLVAGAGFAPAVFTTWVVLLQSTVIGYSTHPAKPSRSFLSERAHTLPQTHHPVKYPSY